MKKLIALLLCGALTFSTVSLTGCKGNTDTTEETEKTSESTSNSTIKIRKTNLDISMEAIEDTITPTSVDVQITNNSGSRLEYGEEFSINVWEDDEWKFVDGDYNFNAIACLNDDQQFTETIEWDWICGELPAGTYRIVKEFTAEKYCKVFDLTAEFTIE